MFYEYALEPELVAHWCERAGYAAFMKRFGIDARRIVSRFPKKWERWVEDAFLRKYPSPTLLQKQRKTEIISYLTRRMIKRGSINFDGTCQWLENAEKEHSTSPFHGIVATSNPRNHPAVTVVCESADILERFDHVPSGSCEVARTPSDMASALAPLLRCCGCAVFIDPHFDAKQRFLEPFRLFLEELITNSVTNAPPVVELHVAVENILDVSLEKIRAAEKISNLQRALPNLIPHGHSIRVVVWRERLRGQKLHNRYLLTDIGSVYFGTGLDCNEESFNQSLRQSQTDDIACLSSDLQDKRWCEYVSAPAFDKVAEAVIIGSY